MAKPSSPEDIAKLALDLISEEEVITNITTPVTTEEAIVARWYDQTRLKVLRMIGWNFAIKRSQLASSVTAPEFGFSTAYPVPSDFIKLLTINGAEILQLIRGNDYEFEGGEILVNEPSTSALKVRYVRDVTDVTKFDPMFTDLLIRQLAHDIAFKFRASTTDMTRLEKLVAEAKEMAISADGQERPPIRVERSGVIEVGRQLSGEAAPIDYTEVF